jgi:hypothetical protein
MDIIKSATTAFIHKSAKGAITLMFTDGDISFTVFGEDMEPEAVQALKARLNPELQTKGDRKYYMTKGKVMVSFRPKGSGPKSDETGRLSATAFVIAVEDAPNQLDMAFGGLDFGSAAVAVPADKLA